MLKKIGIGIGGVIALFVIVGLLLPSEFGMSRSRVIKASPEVVFAQVNDVKKSQAWSPWSAADDTMKIEFGSVLAGKGASYKWTSENMGDGELTILESTPSSKIVNNWAQASGGGGKGEWTFEAADGGTKATWAMSGDAGMNLMARYFGLMMDGMMGGYFEDGLDRLAKVSEAIVPAAAEAAPAEEDAPKEEAAGEKG